MSASTFCFIKAGIGAAISVSGLAWATPWDQWPGRLWFLIVIATACFSMAGVALRIKQQHLSSLQLGIEIGQAVKDAREEEERAGVRRIRP